MFWAMLLAFSSSISFAQLDPLNSILLNNGADEPRSNSSRYSTRPNQRIERERQPLPEQPPEQYEVPFQDPLQGTESPVDESMAELEKKTQVDPTGKKSNKREAPKSAQYDELVFGGDSDAVRKYKASLHPNDLRLNVFELRIAPTYFYLDSQSKSWYRQYTLNSPGMHLGATVWFTPFVGIAADYYLAFGADIPANVSHTRRTKVDNGWLNAGLRFRKFFSSTRRTSFLQFGLDFYDYKMQAPVDDVGRITLQSSGARILAQFHQVKSLTSRWLYEVELLPRLKHKEIATGLEYNSGSSNETNGVGIAFGSYFNFNGKTQVFWKIKHLTEKNVFAGSSNQTDPVSGVTLEGVGVNHTATFFELGFEWSQ